MRALPPDVAGPDNDLADVLDHYVQRAIAEPDALVYAFGERWGPESVRDKVFGFRPGNGVHDIHMNQGNSARFRRRRRRLAGRRPAAALPGESRWVGIFLAFQSQAWHTDDATGHALGARRRPARPRPTRAVRDPRRDGQPERRRPRARDRAAAQRLARSRSTSAAGGSPTGCSAACALPSVRLDAGAVLTVALRDRSQLGNKGGSITLLDKAGLKVAGVAYTAEEARREGWTVTF